MGLQIIKQPDGNLAVRSSETDTIVMWDATRDEVVKAFADMAAADARRHAERLADFVLTDRPREAYYQFVVTWDQAVADDREHGGEYTASLAPDVAADRGEVDLSEEMGAAEAWRIYGDGRRGP